MQESTILGQLLDRQRMSFLKEGVGTSKMREDRIFRAIALIVDNQGSLCEAMNADYGQRSVHQSRMADIYGAVESLKYAKKHVAQWMKDEKRKVKFPLNLFGAKANVRYQAKGVVGAISTWNFPIWVPFSPLGGIFAAGNRCMIKLSEFTPTTSSLIEQLIGQYFDETELAAVNGSTDVATEFSALPFDHILFTGATGIGRHVMRAAAENLVPVTLELGGKSPVIISRTADLKKAAKSIVAGKSLNVGQVCLSPDYVFVPRISVNEFIAEVQQAFKNFFPTMLDNTDYTSIINARHYQRLMNYIQDAREKNGEVWEINPANENFNDQKYKHKMQPFLIIDPSENMLCMQEEIFGPIIPIKTYNHIDETIEYIASRPRPLALYYFGNDDNECTAVLERTCSGGATINDVIQHVSCEDLPFGGVGASGMGSYHGFEGFKTFSHTRAIYRQAKIDLMTLTGLVPPYGDKATRTLNQMITK